MEKSLEELLQLCGKIKYEFIYSITEEKKNSIVIDNDNMKVELSISDPNDESLSKLLDEKFKELQQLLN